MQHAAAMQYYMGVLGIYKHYKVTKLYSTVKNYRGFNLKYTTDLYCGLNFKHTVGGQICTVGLNFSINITTVLCTAVQYGTGRVRYRTVQLYIVQYRLLVLYRSTGS